MTHDSLQERLHTAQTLLSAGRMAEAAQAFERLRAQQDTPANMRILVMDGLGRCHHALQDYTAAAQAFAEALRMLEKIFGHDHPHVAGALQNLARAQSAQGNAPDACAAGLRAVDIVRHHVGAAHPRVADALLNLSSFYYEGGNYAEAETLLRQAMEIWENAIGRDSLEVSTCLNNLGRLHEQNGSPAQGALLHEQAVNIHQRLLGDHPETAFSLGNWGAALADAQQWDKALAALERAVACYQRLGMGDDDAARVCRHNAEHCRAAKIRAGATPA